MAKKSVKYSMVDAFTDLPFKGNPATVCLLEEERDDKWMQAVAAEFNISQTCYLTRIVESEGPANLINATSNPRFRLRWFTPVCEVKLCGHATLAAAHTLFSSGLVASSVIEFVTLSGVLTAKKIPDISIASACDLENGENQDRHSIELDFPADPSTEFHSSETSQIPEVLKGTSIVEIKRTSTGDDILVEVTTGKSVVEFKPRFDAIVKCPGRGIIVTAAAPSDSGFDFYSRFFCPKYGINEDPVCGTAHCALASYWSKKLVKFDLNAYQASPRGGVLNIHVDEPNQRVLLRGKAVTVEVTSGKSLVEFKPQFDAIVKCPARGILVTAVAPSDSGFDFYSRFFCPKNGINEDSVTGSAHCAVASYWSKKLGKSDFHAYLRHHQEGELSIFIMMSRSKGCYCEGKL